MSQPEQVSVRQGVGERALGARRGLGSRVRKTVFRFALRKPLGTVGAFLCLFLILVAVFATAIASHEPKEIIGDPYIGAKFTDQWNNWGTDYLGRDVFSRVVYGSRTSLLVGFTATLWGTTLGLLWGLTQGYWGGRWFDTVSQRMVEAQQSIPGLLLAMTFVAVLGPSIRNVILAIGINYIPTASRTIRSQVLSVREYPYVEAARAIGVPNWRIMLLHILPNVISLYIIQLSLHVGGAIIAESSLSFLGLGAGIDEPTWGGLVTQGTRQALYGGIPWLAILPGMAIAMTVYGFNLFGDALRDVLDPRLRGGR